MSYDTNIVDSSGRVPSTADVIIALLFKEFRELPGGYYAPRPPCSQYKLQCGASLTDDAVQSFVSECKAPNVLGKYWLVIGQAQNEKGDVVEVVETIEKQDKWVAKCYELKLSPIKVGAEAIGVLALILMFINPTIAMALLVLAGVGFAYKFLGGEQ